MIICNYFKKIGCESLSHNEKAVKSYWISHGGSGLMHVFCCPDCARIVEETDSISCSSIIQNNN